MSGQERKKVMEQTRQEGGRKEKKCILPLTPRMNTVNIKCWKGNVASVAKGLCRNIA